MYKPALLGRREQANKCLLVQTQGRESREGCRLPGESLLHRFALNATCRRCQCDL